MKLFVFVIPLVKKGERGYGGCGGDKSEREQTRRGEHVVVVQSTFES